MEWYGIGGLYSGIGGLYSVIGAMGGSRRTGGNGELENTVEYGGAWWHQLSASLPQWYQIGGRNPLVLYPIVKIVVIIAILISQAMTKMRQQK